MWDRLITFVILTYVVVFCSAAAEFRRQACASVYVFGARETTASPGYGSTSALVQELKSAFTNAGSEAIAYPACGGQASCGGVSYDASQNQGTAAVVKAIDAYTKRCPETQIILVGYSQGGQIMDNAVCGGGSQSLSSASQQAVKAVILLGDPRFVAGLPYNVGTCKAQGFAARPKDFVCAQASKVQSYCDSTDPYCCKGNDANSHQQYVKKYGAEAMSFIKSHVSH